MNDNQQFQRTEIGKGGLFRNTSKQPGSNQPDFTGKVTLEDGTEQRISGWNATGQQSGPYIRFKIWTRSSNSNEGSQPTAQGDSIFPTDTTNEPSAAFGQQVQQQPNQQQLMSQGQDEIPF